ncbi:major facilitator superfamily domain-containing protein [Podospora aff. communis PSN243]|uniref:Major facilitator superfamily domain-containing protein n=1 Tax=Podospora aff. communis PSN243 TaxID=3040156 RepID=A0AAV9GJE1_9PEZI|nr:major facilitator superfamily domain-containing protein [Podospora aff. communis PSN243]
MANPASAGIIVDWEPEDTDSGNPLNWPKRKKWANVVVISAMSFLVPLVSTMLAPAVPLVMKDFNTTSTTFQTFCVSIFVLGFASGPLLLAPLSELYGRVIVYHVTNILFLSFTIMCALSSNQGMLLAARFLSGFAGVASMTIGSGTIADMMPKEQRGRAVAVWSLGTILGPMVGPIVGGHVAERYGWRWMFWILAMLIGLVTHIAFVILRETNHSVLLERRAAALRKSTGNLAYRSALAPTITPVEHFKLAITRPTKMIVFCPVVTICCLYVALLYSIMFLLFTTYSYVFQEVYHFMTSSIGLVFIAGAVGTLIGIPYVGGISDRTLKQRMALGKTLTPEDRLPLVITLPGSLAFPIGVFIYGWSAEAKMQWIVPQIGTGIMGFGAILMFIAIQTYLMDAFEEYAASAVGASAVLRGVAAALVPLGAMDLYQRLGLGWGNSLLGFLALGFAPVPMLLGAYGHKIRELEKFKVRL